MRGRQAGSWAATFGRWNYAGHLGAFFGRQACRWRPVCRRKSDANGNPVGPEVQGDAGWPRNGQSRTLLRRHRGHRVTEGEADDGVGVAVKNSPFRVAW